MKRIIPLNAARSNGVTLIELLIVLAIIVILATIATVNFLEAQTRSKVSRARGDMRTLLVGLASYVCDHGNWFEAEKTSPILGQQAFSRLSTPISYLSTVPTDPFYHETPQGANDPALPFYGYMNMTQLNRLGLVEYDETWEEGFFIVSRGPDGDFDANDIIDGELLSDATIYDPYNGTRSGGDLFLGYGGFSGDTADSSDEDE